MISESPKEKQSVYSLYDLFLDISTTRNYFAKNNIAVKKSKFCEIISRCQKEIQFVFSFDMCVGE